MQDLRPDRRLLAAEAWPLAALLVVVSLAWCTAGGIRSLADFGRPPAYIEDPTKGDIVAVYTGLQAMREGDSPPFFWKRVRRLNAPFEAEWNDWPSLDELHYLVLASLARTFGVFGGLNTALLIGHLLAAGTFYGVARVSGAARLWSFVGGLAYGLAPFLFAQSPHHSAVQWAWHVPLFTLVWRWVATDPGIEPRSRRFRQATGIGFLTGLLNVYYTNIFCQLTLVGAALRHLRTRSRPAFLSALAVIAAAAAGFALSNLDTWTFKAAHGANPGAFSREFRWLEVYGLKIKDLVIPPVTHRSEQLARFGLDHRRQSQLNDEEGSAYQGMIGIACLAWLVATAVSRMAFGREKEVPLEAWQVLWIVVMFTTGGLNAILGAAGFTLFRTACRYSVVILAITLLWAARRLTEITAGRTAARRGSGADWTLINAAAAVCLVILWDQVPRSPSEEMRGQIDRQVAADRDFTARMEEALPEGAMVFQMPVMDYPESPIPGVPSYDHFRPYLFSRRLRFSFGSHKGRERERWQAAVQRKFLEQAKVDQQAGIVRFDQANARAAVEELERLGFAAIYVNRNWLPDRGKGIEETLLKLGCTRPPIRSEAGDLECIVLRGVGGSDQPPRP